MTNLTLPTLNSIDVEGEQLRQQQLLTEWNNTSVDYPLDRCFAQLFEERVAAQPNSIAVVFQDRQLTYQQLNNRANRWARLFA